MMCAIWLAAVIMLTVAPAYAADEIAVSTDGVSWSSSLAQPLFDPNFRWVPGDDEATSFYVRNQGVSGAQLRVNVQSTDPSELVADDDIVVWARAGGGTWIRIMDGAAPTSVTDRIVGEGAVTRIDLRVRFNPTSVNQSQVKSVRLAFVVTLSQAVAGRDSDDGGGGDDSDDRDRNGFLPGAGSTLHAVWLWLAAALIGGGIGMRGRFRHEGAADV